MKRLVVTRPLRRCSLREQRQAGSLLSGMNPRRFFSGSAHIAIVILTALLSICATATASSKATIQRHTPASALSSEATLVRIMKAAEESHATTHRPQRQWHRSQQKRRQQQLQQQHSTPPRQEFPHVQQQQQQQRQHQKQLLLPSPSRPKAFFVTYGSGKYLPSMARLVQEAKDSGEFDVVHGYTPGDIDGAFARANARVLEQERGDGFWLWKPYFVRRVMREEMQAGDVLFYADAGCEFKGSPRPYLDLARRYGFLGFRLSFVVKHWTKGDVFRALDMDMGTFGDERQMVGGIFAMMKTPSMTRFLDEWLHFARQPQLVDDSPSVAPNAPGFVEHRHDQAIFTLLVYKHGLALVLEDETDKPQYITGLHHLMNTSEWYKETKVIFAARGKNDISKQI